MEQDGREGREGTGRRDEMGGHRWHGKKVMEREEEMMKEGSDGTSMKRGNGKEEKEREGGKRSNGRKR